MDGGTRASTIQRLHKHSKAMSTIEGVSQHAVEAGLSFVCCELLYSYFATKMSDHDESLEEPPPFTPEQLAWLDQVIAAHQSTTTTPPPSPTTPEGSSQMAASEGSQGLSTTASVHGESSH